MHAHNVVSKLCAKRCNVTNCHNGGIFRKYNDSYYHIQAAVVLDGAWFKRKVDDIALFVSYHYLCNINAEVAQW